jgi:hypothetical protein
MQVFSCEILGWNMKAKNLMLVAAILGMTNVMQMGNQRQVYVAPGHGKVFPKVDKPVKKKKEGYGAKQLAKRLKRSRDYFRCIANQYQGHARSIHKCAY